jgi:RNA polymerase sigma-70 factor, ECF subfamily
MMNRPRFFDKMLITAHEADWEAVYNTELPRIYNFFLYRICDEDTAEDLTAATFEKAWRERHRYRRDLAGFSTWVFTIARRVAIDHFRKTPREIPLDAIGDPPSDELVEALTQRRADLERLAVLLARLPDRERELVALKFGAGLTNRLIARLCGLSESNVGTILHRVTQQLRLTWEAEA